MTFSAMMFFIHKLFENLCLLILWVYQTLLQPSPDIVAIAVGRDSRKWIFFNLDGFLYL